MVDRRLITERPFIKASETAARNISPLPPRLTRVGAHSGEFTARRGGRALLRDTPDKSKGPPKLRRAPKWWQGRTQGHPRQI